MKKYLLSLVGVSLLMLCTSCFDIIEEVSFNDDGSGHIDLTINLSKSKTKISSIMLLDSINKHKVPSKIEIENEIKNVVAQIKKTNGVTNVKSSSDFTNYIFTLSCDFTNVDALNTVISNFSTKHDAEMIKKHKHFKFDKNNNTFTRGYHYNLNKEFKKTNSEDRQIFDTASFTSIYRFKTPIISSENKSAKIAGSKKAIMLRVSAQDILQNKKSIKNLIQLQK